MRTRFYAQDLGLEQLVEESEPAFKFSWMRTDPRSAHGGIALFS